MHIVFTSTFVEPVRVTVKVETHAAHNNSTALEDVEVKEWSSLTSGYIAFRDGWRSGHARVGYERYHLEVMTAHSFVVLTTAKLAEQATLREISRQ